MRQRFWLFSASAVVAGGLALSAGLYAQTKMLPTADDAAPEAKPAPIERTSGDRTPRTLPQPTTSHPLSLETNDEETPQPYVRKTDIPASPPHRRNVKGLFDQKVPVETKPRGHLEEAQIEQLSGEDESETETPIIQADFRSQEPLRKVEPVSHLEVIPSPPEKRTPAVKQPAARPAPAAVPAAQKPAADQSRYTYNPKSNSPAVVVSPTISAAANAEPAMVSIKWVARGDLSVGQESVCTLVVKNEGRGPASEVEVSATFPRTARLLKAEPSPGDGREHLTWSFASLAAGEEKQIHITLMPMARGDLATSATVRFSNAASSRLSVSEPQLAMSVKGVTSTTVGDSATQIVTVSNSGSGVARDIVLSAAIPSGLESPQAKARQIQLAIGSLSGGETRDVRLSLTAIAPGNQVVTIAAKAAGNLEDEKQVTVAVTAPKLEVAIAGPNVRFANRTAKYQVTVTNKGAAATNNVRVTHVVPAGFDYVKADGGGTYNEAQRTVSWFVGHLEAGKASAVHVELLARGLGKQSHKVSVAGDSVSATEAKLDTLIDGAAALVMEVTDLDDPVEVNTQTAYQIRVRNDGSKAATNVGISCELPAGVELIGVEGPTKHSQAKGKIVFAPTAELGPQKNLTFKVMVQGKAAGQLRFRTQLTSAASPEPIVVEELTRFYSD